MIWNLPLMHTNTSQLHMSKVYMITNGYLSFIRVFKNLSVRYIKREGKTKRVQLSQQISTNWKMQWILFLFITGCYQSTYPGSSFYFFKKIKKQNQQISI